MASYITIVYIIMFFFGIWFVLIFLFLHYKNLSRLYKDPEPARLPFVSFLVPAYDEEKGLRFAVEALVKIDYPREKKEILIINDGSKDNTGKIARELEKEHIEVILFDKPNSGKADSLNQAVKRAKGELVAVVDADSYPQPDALKRMVGYFQEEGVAAVTSRVLVKNKDNWLSRFQVLDYSIIAWTRKLLDFVDSVYVTNGPLSVYRKSIVQKVGGFDPKNLTEDIEITWHILSKGYKTRMSYSAIVYTTVPSDLKLWIKQRVRWNLGGLQTIQKYWRTIFRKGAFGNFVIPYVSSSFLLALVGIGLLLRYLWINGSYQAVSIYYSFLGYNYFEYLEFTIYFSLLLLLGFLFFVLAIIYYKAGFKNSETGNKSIIKILAYSFIYRPLYTIPLVLALYKLIKGDIRWYTK